MAFRDGDDTEKLVVRISSASAALTWTGFLRTDFAGTTNARSQARAPGAASKIARTTRSFMTYQAVTDGGSHRAVCHSPKSRACVVRLAAGRPKAGRGYTARSGFRRRPGRSLASIAVLGFLADMLDRHHMLVFGGVEHDDTLGRAAGDPDTLHRAADQLTLVGHQHDLVGVLDRE